MEAKRMELGRGWLSTAQPSPTSFPASCKWWMRESPAVYFPWKPHCWCGAGYHDSRSLIKNPACVLEDEWGNIPDWRTAWPSWYEWIGEDGAEAEAGRLRWGARSESWEEYKGSAALFSFSRGKNSSALWVAAAPWWALFCREGLGSKHLQLNTVGGVPKGSWSSLLRILSLVHTAARIGKVSPWLRPWRW